MLLDINIITISNHHIYSEINNADFFEKYNKIWKKFEELMEINFEKNPPFCNNITYTAKIKTPIEGIFLSFHLLLFYIL